MGIIFLKSEVSLYNLFIMPLIDINDIVNDLKNKGLEIDDYPTFKYYIKNFNVNTFLEEYKDFFMQGGKFKKTKSSELIGLYNFDKNLGNHVLRDVLVLEKIINTNVVYATINALHLKDKCLFKLKKNFLRDKVLNNVSRITPPTNFESLLFKMTKYLDTKKDLRKLIDHSMHDNVFRWKNVPLDIMCLCWSFATTFSFFVALNDEIKQTVVGNLDIPSNMVKGFSDFVENSINIRNLITHNIVLFNIDVKYQSPQLNDFYEHMTGEKINDVFRLPHFIKLVCKMTNSPKLYIKTIEHINLLPLSDEHKQKILTLFVV